LKIVSLPRQVIGMEDLLLADMTKAPDSKVTPEATAPGQPADLRNGGD